MARGQRPVREARPQQGKVAVGPWRVWGAGGVLGVCVRRGRAGPPLPRAVHAAREQPAPVQALDSLL